MGVALGSPVEPLVGSNITGDSGSLAGILENIKLILNGESLYERVRVWTFIHVVTFFCYIFMFALLTTYDSCKNMLAT